MINQIANSPIGVTHTFPSTTMSQLPNWPTTMPVYALVRAGLLDNLLGFLLARGIGLRSLEQGELERREVRCPGHGHVEGKA